MFAGINVLGPTQTRFSLRRTQNIFMPKNINSITINITLAGIEKTKTGKKFQQNSMNNHAIKHLQFEWLLFFPQ